MFIKWILVGVSLAVSCYIDCIHAKRPYAGDGNYRYGNYESGLKRLEAEYGKPQNRGSMQIGINLQLESIPIKYYGKKPYDNSAMILALGGPEDVIGGGYGDRSYGSYRYNGGSYSGGYGGLASELKRYYHKVPNLNEKAPSTISLQNESSFKTKSTQTTPQYSTNTPLRTKSVSRILMPTNIVNDFYLNMTEDPMTSMEMYTTSSKDVPFKLAQNTVTPNRNRDSDSTIKSMTSTDVSNGWRSARNYRTTNTESPYLIESPSQWQTSSSTKPKGTFEMASYKQSDNPTIDFSD